MQNFCFCQLSMQILWRRRCSRVVDLKLPTVKVITRLVLRGLVIGLHSRANFLTYDRQNQKPIAPCMHDFSRALGKL